MNNLKSLFSIGVCISNIKNINNNELIELCHAKCKNIENGKYDFSNEKEIDVIKSMFLKEGYNYLKQVLGTSKFINLTIDKIWGNVNVDRAIGNPHNHRSSLLSLVYYLTKGKIVFQNPYLPSLSQIHQKDIDIYNQYNCDVWELNMIPGDLVVFNSQLLHYAIQTSNDDRITIACDMSMKK